MKRQKSDFTQIPNESFRNGMFRTLSVGAFSLYVYLKYLEYEYTTKESEIFFQCDKQLSELMNVSTKSIERWRQELIDAKLIECERKKFNDKSKTRITNYKILDCVSEKKQIKNHGFKERDFDFELLEKKLLQTDQ